MTPTVEDVEAWLGRPLPEPYLSFLEGTPGNFLAGDDRTLIYRCASVAERNDTFESKTYCLVRRRRGPRGPNPSGHLTNNPPVADGGEVVRRKKREESMMTCSESDMKNGICPKCGAQDIRVQQWFRRPHDFRNYLSLGWWSGGARVYNYACVSCGYLESYIDAADLKKVAGKWDRVAQAEPA